MSQKKNRIKFLLDGKPVFVKLIEITKKLAILRKECSEIKPNYQFLHPDGFCLSNSYEGEMTVEEILKENSLNLVRIQEQKKQISFFLNDAILLETSVSFLSCTLSQVRNEFDKIKENMIFSDQEGFGIVIEDEN